MLIPVFEHTIGSLRAIVNNENEPLQKVSQLLKYDPGLYFTLIKNLYLPDRKTEITSISQAISLIGTNGVERLILQQDLFIEEDYILLWCFSVLAGEAAELINRQAGIAEDEEAFFSGIMPVVGMLLVLVGRSNYKKVLDLLLKISIEDRIFIEEKLYKTSHIEQLDKNLEYPKIYRDALNLMNIIFTKDGQRKNNVEHPAKFSVAYQSFQLFQLMEIAECAAQAILFPSITDRQEKFKELCKTYFNIPEHDAEELLSEIVDGFGAICEDFKVTELCSKFMSTAEMFRSTESAFFTKTETLKKSLETIYAANREGANILIYGESAVGKPLLACALHSREDNPRKIKPFLSFHCSSMESETLEMELFGAKGGFLGLEKHKGSLELANEGTILFRDIDKMPLNLQERLAEILNKTEFYTIGDTQPTSYNVRFILSSRKNIVEEAKR